MLFEIKQKRVNAEGKEFYLTTFWDAYSEETLRKFIAETKPELIAETEYEVKEAKKQGK